MSLTKQLLKEEESPQYIQEPICIEYYKEGEKVKKYANKVSFNHLVGQVYTNEGYICSIKDLISITN